MKHQNHRRKNEALPGLKAGVSRGILRSLWRSRITLGMIPLLALLFLATNYCMKSATNHGSGQWYITNNSAWQVLVRDPETGDQKSIQPEQSDTLERGSSGKLEVNGTHDHFDFQSSASRVTITEPFKGQLILQSDNEVCDCDDEFLPDRIIDCDFCSKGSCH